MKKIKNMNGYAIYQAGTRDVAKYGFEDGSFYVYFASDVRDFGLTNSTPEFEGCGSIEEAEANCTGNFAIAKEIVEERTTAASMEEILEVEAKLDAGMDTDDLDMDGEPTTQEAEIMKAIANEFPDMDPDQGQALASAITSIKPDVDPEWAQQFIVSIKRAAELLAEIFKKAIETVKQIANSITDGFRKSKDKFMDAAMLAASPPPKWWHLYKHAKKARVRKKYRSKLMDNLLTTMAAANTL